MPKPMRTQTFQAILRFMQSQDRNGTWLEEQEDENEQEYATYVLKTIREWSTEQALEITPRVQAYIDYLDWVVSGREGKPL